MFVDCKSSVVCYDSHACSSGVAARECWGLLLLVDFDVNLFVAVTVVFSFSLAVVFGFIIVSVVTVIVTVIVAAMGSL